MATLRYTGPDTTFRDVSYVVEINGVPHHRHWRVGEVKDGGTFDVPDEIAERFTRRSDIEEVTDEPIDEVVETTGEVIDEVPADQEQAVVEAPVTNQAPATAGGDATE